MMALRVEKQVSSFSKKANGSQMSSYSSEAAYTGKQTGDQRSAGKLQISNMDESGDSFVLARVTASSATQLRVIGEKIKMSNTFTQQITNPLRGRKMMGAAFGTRIRLHPDRPGGGAGDASANSRYHCSTGGKLSAFLVGHAFGSQGYTCLPTSHRWHCLEPHAPVPKPPSLRISSAAVPDHHSLPEHQ